MGAVPNPVFQGATLEAGACLTVGGAIPLSHWASGSTQVHGVILLRWRMLVPLNDRVPGLLSGLSSDRARALG